MKGSIAWLTPVGPHSMAVTRSGPQCPEGVENKFSSRYKIIISPSLGWGPCILQPLAREECHKREEIREVKEIPYNSGARAADREGDSQGLCYPHLCRQSLRSPPSAGPGGEDSQHLLRQALHLQSFGSISQQALPVSCRPKWNSKPVSCQK